MADPIPKERALADRPLMASRTSYEEDAYTWALEQCALLEAGQFDRLDIANLLDEVGDVARREFDKLVSALRVLMQHLLKWDHQPERRSRSWVLSIAEQREQISAVLEDNPGLKSRQDEAARRAYRQGRLGAAKETDLPLDVFPAECPYSWDDLMRREIPQDPNSGH
jgi:predicted DNA-binding ribbon-helix-helix protein